MRWEICFNLSVLRMLSYALDLHWRRRLTALSLHEGPGSLCAQPDTARTDDTCSVAASRKATCPTRPLTAAALRRQQTPLPSEGEYALLPYLAYVLYVPLYLAGPIITFQDFAWQLRQRSPPRAREVSCGTCSFSPTVHVQLLPCTTVLLAEQTVWLCPISLLQVLQYATRLAADWACLELLTHCLYFNSIAKHRIGLRYRQHGLQFGNTEMGKCYCSLVAQRTAPRLAGCMISEGEALLSGHCLASLTPSTACAAALTAFWVLCFMWLKFATIWRFMR